MLEMRKMKNKNMNLILVAFYAFLISSSVISVVGQQGETGPYLDELLRIIIPEPSAQVAALVGGDVDSIQVGTPEDAAYLAEQGFTLTLTRTMSVQWLCWNLRRAPFNDTAFRKAVAHLIPKEDLIAEYFGVLAEPVESIVPSSYGRWWNPDLEPYEYDPAEADRILNEAGYVIDPETGKRMDPRNPGNLLRQLEFMYIPGGAQGFVTEAIVDELVNAGFDVNLVAVTEAEAVAKLLVPPYDWDMFRIGYFLSPYYCPPYIYFHSKQRLDLGGFNYVWYNNSRFDTYAEKLVTSVNETEVEYAYHMCQEIAHEDLPVIPLWTPINCYAYDPDLMGYIESPVGIRRQLIQWKPEAGGPGGTFKTAAAMDIDSLNPCTAVSEGMEIVDYITDQLTFEHPYTVEYKPWIATNWKLETFSDSDMGVTLGTKTTIWLRDDVYWHDGVKFTADDIKFCIEYSVDQAKRGELLVPLSMIVDDFIKVECVDLGASPTDPTPDGWNEVVVYHNKTSLWIFEFLQYWAPKLPKHIWNPDTTKYGDPPGIPEGSYPEQVGYGVANASLFRPWEVPHPTVDNLTCLIGLGPWIFPKDGWVVGSYTRLVANRNYFKRVLISDTNFDFEVNIRDIFAVAKAFGSEQGDPRWNIAVDVNGDLRIDIRDIFVVAKDFGKTW